MPEALNEDMEFLSSAIELGDEKGLNENYFDITWLSDEGEVAGGSSKTVGGPFKAVEGPSKVVRGQFKAADGLSEVTRAQSEVVGNDGGLAVGPSRAKHHSDYIDSNDTRSYISTSFRFEADVAQRKNDKVRVIAKCDRIGYEWEIVASKHRNDNSFKVKTYLGTHNCLLIIKNKKVIARVLARKLKDDIIKMSFLRARQIRVLVRKQLGVAIGLTKAKRVKLRMIKEVRDNYVEEFRRLKQYADELLETNEGSTIKIEVDRSVPNEGLVKEQLLVAVGQDGNNQMFPFAWAVVNGVKNKDHWKCFLELLCADMGIEDGMGWTIISDMQKLEFKKQIELLCSMNKAAYNHLLKNWDAVHWCQAFFSNFSNCNVIDNNIASEVATGAPSEAANGASQLPSSASEGVARSTTSTAIKKRKKMRVTKRNQSVAATTKGFISEYVVVLRRKLKHASPKGKGTAAYRLQTQFTSAPTAPPQQISIINARRPNQLVVATGHGDSRSFISSRLLLEIAHQEQPSRSNLVADLPTQESIKNA
ncbi:Gag-pol polyprotein, putative [Theobroma cacao]|uniref:Gag-pol polyprotein, putative n=1 Tax=Theobroma cacao TaxID=3641 RepID=A0A061E391_THECC|nr:Gag-pol polyprotein, putative [Theobroma cacao]